MKTKEIIEITRQIAGPFRVTKGESFRLKDVVPSDTLDFTKEEHKPLVKEALAMGVAALADLQDKLYARDRWAVLLIFQAMDAAGKDGAIKHVMSGVNPQGCQVYSFKSPSSEDLDHDYLWRCMKCLPNRGHIGIFNRSYYEEVLVVRIHPEFLVKQKLPPELVDKNIWGAAFRRHPQFRTIPDEERCNRAEILSPCFKEGTETAVPGANRRHAEELEVLFKRCSRAGFLG
jgi:polyphosphate kinase 2 (PPK2 family)